MTDIADACESISNFTAGVTKADFLKHDLVQSAVIRKFTIIGEAASKISPETKNLHPDVNWKILSAFRNILVHVYFGTIVEQVWTVTAEYTSCDAGPGDIDTGNLIRRYGDHQPTPTNVLDQPQTAA